MRWVVVLTGVQLISEEFKFSHATIAPFRSFRTASLAPPLAMALRHSGES